MSRRGPRRDDDGQASGVALPHAATAVAASSDRTATGGADDADLSAPAPPEESLAALLGLEGRPWLTPGQLVDGAYRIERMLGQGGMAQVFLAEDIRLDRHVALKILRGRQRTRRAGSIDRLIREARALAKLIHPNVVTVFDVGAVDDEVYVVMEYVDGGTVRRWQAPPRPWRAIVDVYLHAGRGLAAAHEAGFVHRDVKPDNILVGSDGRVRVADFGLVRHQPGADLDEPPAGPGELPAPAVSTGAESTAGGVDAGTATGTIMGTPAYMAPEQFAGEVSPRTDQFSWCVALWEALYGERPFAAPAGPPVAEPGTPPTLRPPPRDRQVPSHVRDALVRGLSLDPAARFPSMTALLTALSREPGRVRRRAALAVAAAIALGGGGWQLTRARHAASGDPCAATSTEITSTWSPARADAVTQAFVAVGRPYARRAAERATDALGQFASRWSTARTAACRDELSRLQPPAIRRLRDRCLDRAREQFAALIAALAVADAKAVDASHVATAELPKLERCDDAERLQREPLAGVEVLPPALVTLDAQATAATVALDLGHFKEAHALIDPVVASLGDGDGGDATIAARAFYVDGMVSNVVNEPARAQASLERAARLAAQSGDDRTVANTWLSLIEVLDRQGKAEAAEGLRAVAEAALARCGQPPELRARLLLAIGRMRSSAGRLAEARTTLDEARAIIEATGTKEELAVVLNRLGVVAKRDYRLDDARALFERTVALQVELHGRDHPYTLAAIGNLASLLNDIGDYAAALPIQQQVLAARLASLGPRDPTLFSAYTNLGLTYQGLGRYDDALTHLAAASELARAQPAPRPRWIALNNLGSLALERGDVAAARAHLDQALAIGEDAVGRDSPELLPTLLLSTNTYAERGDGPNALTTVARAGRIARTLAADDPNRLWLGQAQVDALLAAHRVGPARELAVATVASARAAGAPGRSYLIDALVVLGRSELASGHGGPARAALTEARGLLITTRATPDSRVARIDRLLAGAR